MHQSPFSTSFDAENSQAASSPSWQSPAVVAATGVLCLTWGWLSWWYNEFSLARFSSQANCMYDDEAYRAVCSRMSWIKSIVVVLSLLGSCTVLCLVGGAVSLCRMGLLKLEGRPLGALRFYALAGAASSSFTLFQLFALLNADFRPRFVTAFVIYTSWLVTAGVAGALCRVHECTLQELIGTKGGAAQGSTYGAMGEDSSAPGATQPWASSQAGEQQWGEHQWGEQQWGEHQPEQRWQQW